MITISLCMIVKNEEDTLDRCLESVQDIVDEIIIVDTGSTDKTKEIAQKFTDKIYDFEWIEDFSAARNYSFEKATMEYILWLDADDVILPEDKEKFKKLKRTFDPSVDMVMMKYNYAFNEEGKPSLSFFRERLSRRSLNVKWIDPIHEYIHSRGKVINSDICITHKRVHNQSGRNLRIFEKMIENGVEFSPRNRLYFAKELFYNRRYKEAVENFKIFLDGKEGWFEDNIRACFEISICYMNLKDEENRLKYLLRSFEYDAPRAEICCQIGYCFMDRGDFKRAAFWYKLATTLEKPEGSWGFVMSEYWGFIPNIQLALCCSRLGNIEEARKYNEIAAKYKPNNPSVLQNRRYYESLKKKEPKL